MFGTLGLPELLIILVIVVLIFGANRLPQLARGLGSSVKNFKEGDWNEIDVTVKGGIITNTVNGKALTTKDVLELTVKDGKPAARLNGQAIEVAAIQCMVSAEAVCKCNGELIGKPMRITSESNRAKTSSSASRRVRPYMRMGQGDDASS